ncbi:hypothetical protein [Aureibacter tunicatorum]|uniref:Uncharacterized membrane protein (DUF485 family) n=1 Tax=Aureibacter tunicatorum TaxID=866807 RepID=A0AAE3XK73_9BACT|nr:hypothetical protein [Aureibacter tunicatorum]MDR6238412.1 uncharacterized membrane protein (DUF485 family) [Aureibacter tunicatorum]BDD03444.1 hypothetical protein AUTU_09270 [Aureibacter tunicatorum]
MYQILLNAHFIIACVIILMSIGVLIKSYSGWLGNKAYSKGDNGMTAGFVGLIWLNCIIGLALYFAFSPITEYALQHMGEAMKNSKMRFYAVEHISVMFFAAIVAQVARVKVKKASSDLQKFKLSAIFYTITFALLVSRIPWDRVMAKF